MNDERSARDRRPRRAGLTDPRRLRDDPPRRLAARRALPHRPHAWASPSSRQDQPRRLRDADPALRAHRQPRPRARSARSAAWSATWHCRTLPAVPSSAWSAPACGCSWVAAVAASWPRRITWRSAGVGVAGRHRPHARGHGRALECADQPSNEETVPWQPIASFVPEASIPEVAQPLQIQGGLISAGTERLIQSAFDTYSESVTFYDDLADQASGLRAQLHQPEEGEEVAVLVSDRHDNVGMDRVARAIADEAGATVLLDARRRHVDRRAPGRRSASTRSTRPSKASTTSTSPLATTTKGPSSAATSTTSVSPSSTVRWSSRPVAFDCLESPTRGPAGSGTGETLVGLSLDGAGCSAGRHRMRGRRSWRTRKHVDGPRRQPRP